MWLALQINIWVVLVSIGSYQLFMLLRRREMKPFSEGFTKHLQYLIGIPTLALLIVLFFKPDAREFGIVLVVPELIIVGTIVFNLAALMNFWAHLSLGNFWTCDLGTRSDHHLVESGLYRWIRHPLYTSFFLITVGFFLMTGDWLITTLMLAHCWAVAARASKEEEMLLGRLGQSYASYMQRTGCFLPRSKGSIAPIRMLSKDRI
jgi:protein-S-isoprenylcysteine O-methyltransferase Ste14